MATAMLKIFCFASVLATAFSVFLVCPPQETLVPCHCTKTAFGMQVVCVNLNKSEHLIRVLHFLKDYRILTILLRGLNFSDVLPSNLFEGVMVKEIRIQKSNLKFSQPAFSGLEESLHVLDVSQQSIILSKDRFTLALLYKLREFSFQYNRLKRVEDRWLNEMVPYVHKIVLDHNEIETIEDHAFFNLYALGEISIADNRIKTVVRSMFPRPAYNLEILDLSFNHIQTLPEDFFLDMRMLKSIKLAQNKLMVLAEYTWAPVWEQLDQTLLYDNPFYCDNKMNWIKDYHLKGPIELEGTCMLPRHLKDTSLREAYYTDHDLKTGMV